MKSLLRRLYEHVTPSRRRGGVERHFRLPLGGFVFMAVTMLIGFAAMNTSTQLLFLVFAMLLSFWILSAVMASVSLWGVTVRRDAPRLGQAGKPLRVRLRAHNSKKRFASLSLRVNDVASSYGAVGAAYFASVAPQREQERSYACVFPRRGHVRFERLRVATFFPFSLIERILVLPQPAEVLILPPLIRVEDELRRVESEMGEAESRQKGSGVTLHGLRPYVIGDSARDIHWKTTAKTGQVIIREHEAEERRRVSVLLDNRLPQDPSEALLESLEEGIVLAGSLVAWADEHGHDVELVTASGRVAFSTGPHHVMQCRRALALLKPASEKHPAPQIESAAGESLHLVVGWRPGSERRAAAGASAINVEPFRRAIRRSMGIGTPEHNGAHRSRETMEDHLDGEDAASETSRVKAGMGAGST